MSIKRAKKVERTQDVSPTGYETAAFPSQHLAAPTCHYRAQRRFVTVSDIHSKVEIVP